jgi:hypothetical protein
MIMYDEEYTGIKDPNDFMKKLKNILSIVIHDVPVNKGGSYEHEGTTTYGSIVVGSWRRLVFVFEIDDETNDAAIGVLLEESSPQQEAELDPIELGNAMDIDASDLLGVATHILELVDGLL